jgi:hypothetical protein
MSIKAMRSSMIGVDQKYARGVEITFGARESGRLGKGIADVKFEPFNIFVLKQISGDQLSGQCPAMKKHLDEPAENGKVVSEMV